MLAKASYKAEHITPAGSSFKHMYVSISVFTSSEHLKSIIQQVCQYDYLNDELKTCLEHQINKD